jgi:glutamyl-Q tRNA(Asp) synthetase
VTAASGYRGRFAPTPSGPLHFGSIVAAAGSRADALAAGGEWHLRIDDLDPPRVAPGAIDAILRCLESLGFAWDGPVVYQSRRREAHRAALEQLRGVAPVYRCTCPRSAIARAGLPGIEGPRYPGTCRDRPAAAGGPAAWRMDVRGAPIDFFDRRLGRYVQAVESATGDFVLWRADDIPSYHLACAVDDMLDGFTDIVRGADLVASTPRQILVRRWLGAPEPTWLHLPLVLHPSGEKLSKQTLAAAVDTSQPSTVLSDALAFLGHPVPTDLAGASVPELWSWAAEHWSPARLPPASTPAETGQ